MRVAVVLSGCGVYDGSEIHEAVITLLNLQRLGAEVSFFAPDIKQAGAVNHLDGSEEPAPRGVLAESARIARGDIAALSSFTATEFDALVFPGGFGAAKNLCTFAADGVECSVNADVERAINSMLELKKPMAFLCIAPVIAAKVVASKANLTIGSDPATAAAIEAMGAVHVNCRADSFVADRDFKIYSTPAYMLAKNTVEIDAGAGKMFAAMFAGK